MWPTCPTEPNWVHVPHGPWPIWGPVCWAHLAHVPKEPTQYDPICLCAHMETPMVGSMGPWAPIEPLMVGPMVPIMEGPWAPMRPFMQGPWVSGYMLRHTHNTLICR